MSAASAITPASGQDGAAPQLGPARRPSSPYARRLARERGLRLAEISGSGPSGRITGADILAAAVTGAANLSPPPPAPTDHAAPAAGPAVVTPVATEPQTAQQVPLPFSAEAQVVPPAAAPHKPVSALAARADLTEFRLLLTRIGPAGEKVSLTDAAIKAAAAAMSLVAPQMAGTGAVTLELGRERQVIRAAGLALSAVAKARLASDVVPASFNLMSLRVIEAAAMRPVQMPLLPGHALRLVIAADEGAAELLLSFDAETLGEDEAARLLSLIRAAFEQPLLLFV